MSGAFKLDHLHPFKLIFQPQLNTWDLPLQKVSFEFFSFDQEPKWYAKFSSSELLQLLGSAGINPESESHFFEEFSYL